MMSADARGARAVPPFHPVLLAIYPVLFLYGQNTGEVRLEEVFLPVGVSLAATTLVCALFYLATRSARKAALAATAVTIAVFGFGPLRDTLEHTPLGGARLLLAWSVVAAVALLVIVRSRREPVRLTAWLNAVAAILLVAVSIPIAVDQVGGLSRVGATTGAPTPPPSSGAAVESARDIYYIIVEDIGSQQTLARYYGLTDPSLFDWLKTDGFIVPAQSRTNYNKTVQTLAAAFNMNYLDEIAARVGPQSGDYRPLYGMIDDNVVARYLKGQGYRYLHIGSWWDPTERSSIADRNYGIQQGSDFASALYQSTILPDIAVRLPRIGIRLPTVAIMDRYEDQYRGTIYGFKVLDQLASQPGPKFVFAHFMVPHLPFVFAADGTRLTAAARKARTSIELFAGQSAYTMTRLRESVERLLAGPEATRPIIIIQTDEGPDPPAFVLDGKSYAWASMTTDELRIKYDILNAFYLPGVADSAVPATISPVNTFRLIFSLYFGADLPLLPDRQMIFRDKAHPYDFTDITDRLASP